MEVRLADFYGQAEKHNESAEAYQASLRRRPNDLAALMGYRDALRKIGREDHAIQVDRIISAVKR